MKEGDHIIVGQCRLDLQSKCLVFVDDLLLQFAISYLLLQNLTLRVYIHVYICIPTATGLTIRVKEGEHVYIWFCTNMY